MSKKHLYTFLPLIAIIFIFPIKMYAATPSIFCQTIYTPNDSQKDIWEGGTLRIKNSFIMDNSEITYNPLLSQTVDFKISWSIPEGISSNNFINSIKNDSTIELGNQIVELDKSAFTIDKDTVTYTFSKNEFDFWALLKWLASLIFNSEIVIKTNLLLDVNLLSEDFEFDKSKDHIVTRGKLPPNLNKELSVTIYFYNRKNIKTLNYTSGVPTWNSYISPWNQKIAGSLNNGKEDDTQLDGTTEVNGISHILKGNNFKNRVVDVPISVEINPSEYFRVVNLYEKETLISDFEVSEPSISDKLFEINGIKHLVRTSNYQYFVNDLSPVDIKFNQETTLDFILDTIPTKLADKEEIKLKGKIESEGDINQYYFKVNGEEKQKINNLSTEKGVFFTTIEGLDAGVYEITVGIVNEYSLEKEISFPLEFFKEELSINSISPDIHFGTHKIPNTGDKFYNELPFFIKILDTYQKEKNWRLAAKLNKPLQTDEADFLPAEIYLNKNKIDESLTTIFINNKINNGITEPIKFEENEGFYLHMNSSNVKTYETYHGTLQFVIQIGP